MKQKGRLGCAQCDCIRDIGHDPASCQSTRLTSMSHYYNLVKGHLCLFQSHLGNVMLGGDISLFQYTMSNIDSLSKGIMSMALCFICDIPQSLTWALISSIAIGLFN